MTDTQVLLNRIVALRQRLEQAHGRPDEAEPDDEAARLRRLEQQLAAGERHTHRFDRSLRRLAETTELAEATTVPTQLIARAYRLLEQGRGLLGELRSQAEELEVLAALEHRPADDEANDDPLLALYQETAALADTALRTVQAFPDSPTAQLQLCTGLEATLKVVDERLRRIQAAAIGRRRQAERIDRLATLLQGLSSGQAADLQPFVELAESILAEADDGEPLRFLGASPQEPARFVACHGLTTAQVMARLVRHDPELRGRAEEYVLAALLHDVGMLRVPADILKHPGSLDDEQCRAIEAHTRRGADLVVRLLSHGAWLADAVASHHERLDGTGYPAGLRDLQIASLPRLLAVCDVYAALCTARPHRPALDPRTALTDVLLMAEQGTLDRQHAERLLVLSFYPAGSAVELADGSAGVVVATHQGRRERGLPARPVVALLTDTQGRALPAPLHRDLAECDGRSIVRTLPATERRLLFGRWYPEWAA